MQHSWELSQDFHHLLFRNISVKWKVIYRVSQIKSALGKHLEIAKQDGPSLESSSYLNVTLRYLGPLDPGTLGLLDLFLLPTPSHTSSYILLYLLLFHHPISSSYLILLLSSFGIVGMGGGLSCDIGDWDWRWTFDLYIDVKKFTGGWVVVGGVGL